MPSDITLHEAAPARSASTLQLQFRRFRKNWLAMVSVWLLAVSYTHLDVYKRQTSKINRIVTVGYGSIV